jgi:hypothetical protein
MNINAKLHPLTEFDKEASRQGVGANALWNGPLDTTAFPKGKGSSSGIKGIIFNNDKPMYQAAPITQRAKKRF